MAKSFQDEIPPSRVNIRYHNLVTGEEKIELPLKLLLLGDYTFQEDDTPLEERKKLGTVERLLLRLANLLEERL